MNFVFKLSKDSPANSATIPLKRPAQKLRKLSLPGRAESYAILQAAKEMWRDGKGGGMRFSAV